MADYASVVEYAKTLSYVSQAAQSQINDFFSTLDPSQPEATRDALLKFVPAVVQKYGTVAGQLACERYEALRAEQMGEGYSAIPADLPTTEDVSSIVRSQADKLWSDDPSAMAVTCAEIADRLIVQQARNTTMANVDNENANGGKRVRYARIPTGHTTCAWCIMLSGLGWQYRSSSTAASSGHAHCDCVIEPSWEETPHVAGYTDGDFMGYDRMYTSAKSNLPDSQTRAEWNAMSADEREKYTHTRDIYYYEGLHKGEWRALDASGRRAYVSSRGNTNIPYSETIRHAKSDTKASYANYRMKRLLSQMRDENDGLH
jgi:hypothetical protein